ncbi:MAG: hypothetical protein QG597_4308 [Actinomycetota bacterium]|nr:hypothetical protein [Actinomycetota bacterium]
MTTETADRRPIRIANCSGFYGDRLAAAREMVDGGPIDVLTGDWLAELTMTILARSAMKGGPGYARTFVSQMRDVLADCHARGIKVVSNAGGLDPAACAEAVREVAPPGVRIAVVTGDNLSAELDALRTAGETFTNLDTGEAFDAVAWPSLTANAYLGSAPVAAALAAGADVVITGRITDAALVVGPAAWWHGWDLADPLRADAIAGAVVAGHVIECGAQATGGNYPFFTDVPGAEHPGFPIAEVAADGTCVITKHWDTGGLVSVGTVTAQLLYEVGSPTYLTPDGTAVFDTIRPELVGCNRVRLSGTHGEPAPQRLKVAMTRLGGFRNTVELILTGLDIDAKADLLLRSTAGVTLAQALELAPPALAEASRWDVAELDVRLLRRDTADAPSLAAAQAMLRITVKDPDAAKVVKPITAALIESGLSNYPGFYAAAPPAGGTPVAVLWPTSVDPAHVRVEVALDSEPIAVPAGVADPAAATPATPAEPALPSAQHGDAQPDPDVPTVRAPLGALVGARSGDKGGIANIGVWIPDPSEPTAVTMATGETSAWAAAVDSFHDTAAVWAADDPLTPDPAAAARADAAYAWLLRTLDREMITDLLGDVVADGVEIHRFANLRAINIVLPGALGRGVADSTSPDPQAKSLGEYLRSREVDVPVTLFDPAAGQAADA